MVVSLPAVAQQAGLTGAVTDPTGAVIPGAKITLTHKGTGATRTATTGASGGYLIPQLEPGQYRLEISTQGFKTAVRDPVTLPVGITSTLNVTLEIGVVTERVVVEEGTSGLNTVDASIGTPITGAQVLNLPTNSLDPAGLLSLQPGVTFVPGHADSPGGYSGIVDDDGRGGSVNGARSDQTNVTLDGVDNNDSQNGFAFTSALRATQASLQEFRVTTSNYNADQGRSSAAQVQLVTKSGSNSPHGLVYYTHRNDAFGANRFFNNRDGVEKGKDRRHIYGAALGGALVKDRLFLFGNFERLQEAIEGTVLNNVPTESFKDGVILYECADPALCPGGTVAGLTGTHNVPVGFFGLTPAQLTALDPSLIGPNSAVISYFNQFPVANSIGFRDGVNIGGFRFNSPVENDYKTYIARLDFNIDQAGNHTFFARGTLQDDDIVSAQASYPGNPPNQVELVNSRGLAFGYKAILGATAVSNLRYGYTRIGEKFAGVQNSEFVNLNFISELNGFDNPGSTVSTRTRQMPSHHLREDFSVTKGSHTLSFGGEGRFTRNNRTTTLGAFNSFDVNPGWLPNIGRNTRPGAFECFNTAACTAVPAVSGSFNWNDTAPPLLGIITNIIARTNFLADGTVLGSGEPIPRRFAVNEFELYAQDAWRVTPSLTLTLGLRYFNNTPPWETNGNQVAPQMVDRATGQVIPGGLGEWFEIRRNLMLTGGTAGDAPSVAFTLGGPANNAPDFFPRDNDNFSPRVAAAWNPRINNWFFGNGKMVIRGGYSLVHDRIGQGLVASFNTRSFGLATGIGSGFGNCDEGTGRANVPNGACPRFTSPTDTSGLQSFVPAVPPLSFPAVPTGFRISQALNNSITTPFAHTFTLTISREVGNYTFDVGYVGRRGRDLLISKDLAMPLNLTDPGSGRGYFQASQDLIAAFAAGTDISQIAPDPFWETFVPGWGPTGVNGGGAICGVAPGSDFSTVYSSTQVAYDWVNCVHPDTTIIPFAADRVGFPSFVNCSNGVDLDGDPFLDCPEGFFSAQFATLAAWSPDARSEYHSLQVSVRRRLVNGLNFTVNYAFSHSLDHASEPERQGLFGPGTSSGTGGFLVNSWDIDLDYASSSFDMRHQLNANWSAELPIGSGRAVGSGMPGWANQIVGGWALAGIFRANSGLPAEIFNGRTWPTNWNVSGNAMCSGGAVPDFQHSVQKGPCAPTQNVKNAAGDRGPNLFADPVAALDFFRLSNPGERGERNPLRADNYVNLDLSINKSFFLPWEGHILKFRWEMFNVTNSVFFDATHLNTSRQSTASFGNYTDVMGGARQMQVSLRYEF